MKILFFNSGGVSDIFWRYKVEAGNFLTIAETGEEGVEKRQKCASEILERSRMGNMYFFMILVRVTTNGLRVFQFKRRYSIPRSWLSFFTMFLPWVIKLRRWPMIAPRYFAVNLSRGDSVVNSAAKENSELFIVNFNFTFIKSVRCQIKLFLELDCLRFPVG